MTKRYTESDIVDMINKSDKAAMRAVCALFRRQTETEKQAEAAINKNRRGFSAAHASIGSDLAKHMSDGRNDGVMRIPTRGKVPKWIHDGYRANGKNKWRKNRSAYVGRSRVDICREIGLTYRAQLTDIANNN